MIASAGAWEWSALVGARSVMLRLVYASLIPLLVRRTLGVVSDLGGTHLRSGTALVGSSSAALVGHVAGAEVLPRGRLVVGPSLGSAP